MKLLKKYKDLILYVVFGGLTTLVNIVAYWFCAHPLGLPVLWSTSIAWVLAVLFAYLINRRWVFHSEAKTAPQVTREVVSFFLCRLATYFVDVGIMELFANRLRWNDMLVKIGANVVVIILNYAASKLLVFRRKKPDAESPEEEKEGGAEA